LLAKTLKSGGKSLAIRSFLKLAFKTFLAFSAAILVWEIILENAVWRRTGYRSDPVLGRVYRPGVYVHGTEGFCRTHLNSLGMRDSEIPSKTDSEFRVLALGDSFTEGFQVSDKHNFTRVLETTWTGPKKLRVINAGRSGASPAFYIKLGDFYLERIKPDCTIVQLNDEDFTGDMLNSTRNFFVVPVETGYAPVFNTNFVSASGLVQKFPLAQKFLEFSTVAIGMQHLQKSLQTPAAISKGVSAEMQKTLPHLIDWTLRSLKECYPRLIVVYLPAIQYHLPDSPPGEVEEAVNAAAGRSGVQYINMRESYMRYFKLTRQPAHGFSNTKPGVGHINEAGHALLAESLRQILSSDKNR
jgi:hypothetical protein